MNYIHGKACYDDAANLLGLVVPAASIYTAIKALSATQQNNIWTDLSSGSPAKYLNYVGDNMAAIAVLDWGISFSGLPAAAITDAKFRIAALYVQDNPKYLVAPAFDPTINVQGWQ